MPDQLRNIYLVNITMFDSGFLLIDTA